MNRNGHNYNPDRDEAIQRLCDFLNCLNKNERYKLRRMVYKHELSKRNTYAACCGLPRKKKKKDWGTRRNPKFNF